MRSCNLFNHDNEGRARALGGLRTSVSPASRPRHVSRRVDLASFLIFFLPPAVRKSPTAHKCQTPCDHEFIHRSQASRHKYPSADAIGEHELVHDNNTCSSKVGTRRQGSQIRLLDSFRGVKVFFSTLLDRCPLISNLCMMALCEAGVIAESRRLSACSRDLMHVAAE